MLMASREVPLDDDASGPFLPWIVAVMVYLAALAMAAALLINQVTADWQKDLAGGLTVQVPPAAPDETPEAHAAQLEAIAASSGGRVLWRELGEAPADS